jgi:hypothetical protein
MFLLPSMLILRTEHLHNALFVYQIYFLLKSEYDIQTCRLRTFIKITSSEFTFTASEAVFTAVSSWKEMVFQYTGLNSINMLNDFQR